MESLDMTSRYLLFATLSFLVGPVLGCSEPEGFISEVLLSEEEEAALNERDDDSKPTDEASPEAKSETVENTMPSATSSNYKVEATALMAALEGDVPDAVLKDMASDLMITGLAMLPDIITAHPECGPYLTAVKDIGIAMIDLPLSEIESGYHADGKLPKMPSPECYHGKDLVVHPATVAAMAKMGLKDVTDRQKAKRELVEVLGHLKEVSTAKP